MADDITHQQILDRIDITNRQLLDAMTDQLGVITDNMVTKQDLKEELKAFATKDDLKESITRVTTCLDRVERKLDSSQKANVIHHLAVRDGIGSLNRQFGSLREGLTQAASSH